MATDDERLLVRIEAQLRGFEKAMAKATGTASTAAGKIEGRFRTMERNLSGIGAGLGRSLLAPFAALASVQGIQNAADAFIRIENALKIVGLEGEQATAVFDRLFASAQKFGAPMEALVEVFRAGSLAQKELNVTSEELLNFTNGIAAALLVSGRSATESRGALLQLAQAIGSGVVRAEEFNAILEGALPIAQAAARGLKEAGGSVAKLRTLIIDGKVSSEAFFRAFEAGQGTLEKLAETADSTIGQALTRLQNSFIKLVGRFSETTGAAAGVASSIGNVAKAFEELSGWIETVSDSRLGTLIGQLVEAQRLLGRFVPLADPLGNIGGAISTLNEAAKDLVDPLHAIDAAKDKIRASGPVTSGDLVAGPEITAEIDKIKSRIDQGFGAVALDEAVSLDDFAPPSGKKKKTRLSELERQQKAVKELISDLEFERSLIGLTNEQREVEIALRRAGSVATDEQRAQIESLISSATREQEALDAMIDRMDELRDVAGGALSAFNDGVREGEGLLGGLKGALQSVLDSVIRIGEQMAINALFGASGTPGGGLFGGIVNGLFGRGQSAPNIASVATAARAAQPGQARQAVDVRITATPSPLLVLGWEQRAQQGEQRSIARGPAVARDNQMRYATP